MAQALYGNGSIIIELKNHQPVFQLIDYITKQNYLCGAYILPNSATKLPYAKFAFLNFNGIINIRLRTYIFRISIYLKRCFVYMMYNSILEAIGNTPMVKINRLNPNPAVPMYAKLEGFNPTGSIKDRIALKMIEQAEEEGTLTKDKIIIEATSGNTGIGLTMIGVVKGYRVQIVMSSAVSIERQRMIKAFGGEIILTDPTKGTDGAIIETRRLLALNPEKYFNPNQFSNQYNKLAHYSTTAEEIWQQTEGKVTHMVSSLGTSGTLMGVGMRLRERNPNIQIIEAQPVKGHYIQGLKSMEEAIVPAIYDKTKIDESILIDTEEAFEMARQLVLQEGIFIGMSSGAAMIAARTIVEKLTSGLVVVILPDRGEKYLSTSLFQEQGEEADAQ